MKHFLVPICATIQSVSRAGIAAILLVATSPALADCEGLIARMNKALSYPDADARGYVADCKIWPAHPGKITLHWRAGQPQKSACRDTVDSPGCRAGEQVEAGDGPDEND